MNEIQKMMELVDLIDDKLIIASHSKDVQLFSKIDIVLQKINEANHYINKVQQIERETKALQVIVEFASRPGLCDHLLAKRAIARCQNQIR